MLLETVSVATGTLLAQSEGQSGIVLGIVVGQPVTAQLFLCVLWNSREPPQSLYPVLSAASFEQAVLVHSATDALVH